tara:strand:+ start:35852 stop:36325 length:474 start_codon:yes stop_codon:yes gene_type:complete
MAWAVIDVGAEKVMDCGTVRAPKGLTQQQCQDYWHAYARNPALLGEKMPVSWAMTCHLVIEIPDHLKSKSNKQLQDLVALAMCVSTLCQGYVANGTKSYDQIPPREWKGRKSKESTQAEVLAACGKQSKKWSEHVTDAAAIGLWWSRRTKQSFRIVA